MFDLLGERKLPFSGSYSCSTLLSSSTSSSLVDFYVRTLKHGDQVKLHNIRVRMTIGFRFKESFMTCRTSLTGITVHQENDKLLTGLIWSYYSLVPYISLEMPPII